MGRVFWKCIQGHHNGSITDCTTLLARGNKATRRLRAERGELWLQEERPRIGRCTSADVGRELEVAGGCPAHDNRAPRSTESTGCDIVLKCRPFRAAATARKCTACRADAIESKRQEGADYAALEAAEQSIRVIADPPASSWASWAAARAHIAVSVWSSR
jgi:hypothetical protein